MQAIFNAISSLFGFFRNLVVNHWALVIAILTMIGLLFTNFPAFLGAMISYVVVFIYNLSFPQLLEMINQVSASTGLYTFSAFDYSLDIFIQANYYAPLFELFKYALFLCEFCLGYLGVLMTIKLILAIIP